MQRLLLALLLIAGTWHLPALAYDGLVEKKTFSLPVYTTTGGQTLKQVKVGYETYGSLNAAKDNAILITHFFFGNSHAAGKYRPQDKAPGYWNSVIGAGKPIDTDKYFVISADVLSNLRARDPDTITTGPASINPDTGRPYGVDFPVVTIRDFVNVQRELLDSLGIGRLHAVMGPSMGALQALEWAAAYPQRVARVAAAVGTPAVDAYTVEALALWTAPILADPKWNGGRYDANDMPRAGFEVALKNAILITRSRPWGDANFGRKPAAADKLPSAAPSHRFAIEEGLDRLAAPWLEIGDANSFVYLTRAIQLFALGGAATEEEGLKKITAKVLLMPATSDLLFPPAYSRRAMEILKANGNAVDYFEIDGIGGHSDAIASIAKASEAIRTFLSR